MFRSTLLLLVALTLTACESGPDALAPSPIETPEARPASANARALRLAPAGDATLHETRRGHVRVANIGPSGLDGVDITPAQTPAGFVAHVPIRPYPLAGADFALALTSGGEAMHTLKLEDDSPQGIHLNYETIESYEKIEVTWFMGGSPVGTGSWKVEEGVGAVRIQKDGTRLTSFGARSDGLVLNLSLGWNAARAIRWIDPTGQEQRATADRVVLHLPQSSAMDDVTLDARPVRKDSGEAHLDYLIITMENVTVVGDRPVLPVEDVILN